LADSDTIIWISGATGGIGLEMARQQPYPGARIINLSRRENPELENVIFDMTKPETYQRVADSFARELADFRGKRAIFVHNAVYNVPGFVSEMDPATYAATIQANAVAPLILGDMFLRAVGPDYESGLVQMTSAAARIPYEGNGTYCASKAAVEMWVKVVAAELKARGRRTWVAAVRPGFVDTPGARHAGAQPISAYPSAPMVAQALEDKTVAIPADKAARDIWAALPPKDGETLLLFGKMVAPAKTS
jgi:short-subunit dehydrogenase